MISTTHIYNIITRLAIALASTLMWLSLLATYTWAELPTSNNEKHSLTVGLKTDNHPWTYPHKEGKAGLLLDYSEDIFKQTPYRYEFAFHQSYLRLVRAINLGHVDITFAVQAPNVPLPSAPGVHCTGAISDNLSFGFYALKERGIKPTSNIDDLSHYRLAIGRSTQRSRFSNFEKRNVTQHSEISSTLKMLISERSDIASLSRALIAHWQQELGIEFIEIMPLGTYTIHLCASEKRLDKSVIETLFNATKTLPKFPNFELSLEPNDQENQPSSEVQDKNHSLEHTP